MAGELSEVVVIDVVRTAFGRAGEKGIFWKTRADDLGVALVKSLLSRNPKVKPSMIEDSIWGCTNQLKEAGGTIGRMIPILALSKDGWQIPGTSIDRMCAGGLTAVGFGLTTIASGMADCVIAGGVEHLGHMPMGLMRENHPDVENALGDASALSMGKTAENIHDQFPEFDKERADLYAVNSQKKADQAIQAGKMKNMIVPLEVELEDGSKMIADRDQGPRPNTSMEGLASLKTPFRENGRVTPGNSSGLNDGAAAVLLMSRKKADELGLKPTMQWVSSGIVAVDPRIMGIAPVPATEKALKRAELTINDIDIIELNEAFAVQALHNLTYLGLKDDDPRVNIWGGSLAYGHPLAASGPRLVGFLSALFAENPKANYGLTTMCVGRGQGYSIIWKNLS
ncbi:thiolase family protein [bacterium]|nr:thiolase family protein [bacterium]